MEPVYIQMNDDAKTPNVSQTALGHGPIKLIATLSSPCQEC